LESNLAWDLFVVADVSAGEMIEVFFESGFSIIFGMGKGDTFGVRFRFIEGYKCFAHRYNRLAIRY
jgi:hypothetical protein